MLSSLRRSSLVAAIAIAASLGSAPVIAHQPTMTSAAPRPVKSGKRSLLGSASSSAVLYGRKRAGITAAQQQRASRKTRNVARNRRHHR